MSTTLGVATKLLDEVMTNYSQWHTERAPSGTKVNYVEKISSLSDKVYMIMSMLATNQSPIDPNNVLDTTVEHGVPLMRSKWVHCTWAHQGGTQGQGTRLADGPPHLPYGD